MTTRPSFGAARATLAPDRRRQPVLKPAPSLRLLPHVQPAPAQRASKPSLRPALVRGLDALRRAWEAYWNWRARQATIAILSTLDERTLRDIGVTRSEIGSAVHGRRGDRRCAYDENWWR